MIPDRPYRATVVAGEMLFWCTCGHSRQQPYCDGSHQGTSHRPVRFTPQQNLTVALCGCKQTREPPYCDGSHLPFRAAREGGGGAEE